MVDARELGSGVAGVRVRRRLADADGPHRGRGRHRHARRCSDRLLRRRPDRGRGRGSEHALGGDLDGHRAHRRSRVRDRRTMVAPGTIPETGHRARSDQRCVRGRGSERRAPRPHRSYRGMGPARHRLSDPAGTRAVMARTPVRVRGDGAGGAHHVRRLSGDQLVLREPVSARHAMRGTIRP